MEKEHERKYITPEIENKIRNYNRWRNGFATLFALGAISTISAPFFDTSPIKPAIVIEYGDARKSLKMLRENKKNILNKINLLNMPYETPETRELLKDYSQEKLKILKVDKAISSIEKEVLDIENNPNFKDYENAKNKTRSKSSSFGMGGILMYATGLIGLFKTIRKKRKFKKTFEEKIKSK